MKKSEKHWIFPLRTAPGILVFLFSFIISFSAVFISEIITVNHEKGTTFHLAVIQSEKLKQEIQTQLYFANTISTLLQQNNGNTNDLDAVINDILFDYRIKNIALAPNGVITQVYPLEGNEEAVGHDVLHDPLRATEAEEARRSGQLTLSGPYELRQGGLGIIGRHPVFLKQQEDGEYFWGFVCVTLKIPDVFDIIQFENLEQQGYAYELWRMEPDTGEKQIIMHSAASLCKNPKSNTVSLPNSEWYISIAPKNGWINLYNLAFRCLVALLFTGLCCLLHRYIVRLSSSRSELDQTLQQQSENYKKMNQLNGELRTFRHDMHNHMISLTNLLNDQNIAEAQSYIQTISSTFLSRTAIQNTENYVFDALLAEKKLQAETRNIKMECEVLLNRKLNISNMDWSILFGNLLDNALEACESVKSPFIHLKIYSRGNFLHTRISNTAAAAPVLWCSGLQTTKEDKKNHGMGLKQIQSIVRKYHGSMEMSYENQVFTVSFLLTGI